jgi:hypothetical protein
MTDFEAKRTVSRKHLLVYDGLIPVVFMLLAGWGLSEKFAEPLLHALDNQHWGGWSLWFRQSVLRNWIWQNSTWIFGAFPGFVWLIWMRLNLQTDLLSGKRTLERPIFSLIQGFFFWIEDGGELAATKRHYEKQIARNQEKIRQLELEVTRVGQFHADVESQFGSFNDE